MLQTMRSTDCGQETHHAPSHSRYAPPITAAEKATQAIFPWNGWTYPGIKRGMSELCGANPRTVNRWRTGALRLPPRVARKLEAYLVARIAQMQSALDHLREAGTQR